MLRPTLLGVLSLFATSVVAGDLKIRFKYSGPEVTREAIKVNQDAEFCGPFNLRDEGLLVNSENKGIANVVVYVYTGRRGSKLDPSDADNAVHELANDKCRFEPRILAVRAGDTLKVTNPDTIGHNANLNFMRNKAQNLVIPAGGHKEIRVTEAEPAPIPVECNIHPWMKAYVVVADHPYVGISNQDGELVIKDLPEKELVFRIWVEAAKGALKEVNLNGKKQKWSRNKFTYTIEPGENDMGTVTLEANQLRS